MRRGLALVLVALLVAALSASAGAVRKQARGDVALVETFHAGGVIRGAAIYSGYLYVSTPDRLTIYDLEDPDDPQVMSSVISPRLIHGELLSTNGELLLLNEESVSSGRTVDVWDVEDKSNPKLVGTVPSTPDEHMSCILDCRWAYGSEGSILDLRDPSDPEKVDVDWVQRAGIRGLNLHRVDEYRNGFIVTAPRGWTPMTLDVRDPLRPRKVRSTGYPVEANAGFLFSDWPNAGRSRYLFASVEFPSSSNCSSPHDGALMAFDMEDPRGSLASRFFSSTGRDGCTGFYFSFHPRFERTGLIALPQSSGGVRVVRFLPGMMKDVGSFIPLVSDMWLTFWIDHEFFYALSITGEIYILRYTA